MKEIRKRCADTDLYRLIAAAVQGGARYRLTKAGVILYGRRGVTVGTHFSSSSDPRAIRNFRANLKKAGML